MDSEKRLELARTQTKAVGAIRRHVCLETLTRDSPAWYAGMGARVEARAALEQAGGLGRR
jgi:hypothetical protein